MIRCTNPVHNNPRHQYPGLADQHHHHRDATEIMICLGAYEGLSSLEEEDYEERQLFEEMQMEMSLKV